MPRPQTYQWKDPKSITFVGLAVLAFDVVWASLGLLMQLLWGPRADFEGAPSDELTAEQLAAAAHAAFGFVSLLGGIVLVFWILRVSKNAHVLRGRSLDSSPLFAALWWYIIPFMSLFKPLEAMGEIWDASAVDAARRRQNRAALMVWWAALIISGALAYLPTVVRHVGVLIDLKWAASTVQSLIFAYIMKRIYDMQLEKRPALEFSDADESLSVISRIAG